MNPGVIITALICVSIVSISIAGIIQDYNLKKEKIRADAMIRAEEIKAKNQLEIEKLFVENNQRPIVNNIDNEDEVNRNSRVSRERL